LCGISARGHKKNSNVAHVYWKKGMKEKAFPNVQPCRLVHLCFSKVAIRVTVGVFRIILVIFQASRLADAYS
jgi:hypothetical protein